MRGLIPPPPPNQEMGGGTQAYLSFRGRGGGPRYFWGMNVPFDGYVLPPPP